MTLDEEISKVDSTGVLGNHWTLFLRIDDDLDDDVEVDEFAVNTEDRRISYYTTSDTQGATIAGNWSNGSAEGSDDDSLPLLHPGEYLIRFSGGKGYGVAPPEYTSVDYVSQSREFRVVKNEVKHEHFPYERRLTLLPNRGPSY